MQKTIIISFVLCCLSLLGVQAQVVGYFKTVDDNTGKERSVVHIYKTTAGTYAGKIISITDPEEAKGLCEKCTDERKNKPVLGMVIFSGLKASADGNELSGGKILDPESGKEYNCKIWREGNTLKVRGYWGMFYRTQTWLPTNAPK
ncbi:DUF2147 domain-containing protein [Eisenibacter elegans]|jgi:uncharacterized protein (DUF2147 family)|uniref:DUF2147 domain-containing protein n=1 Tax=Eisenibacter elegans TaxID=997 RepID=UPI000402C9E9|nr:DUF2147 domain-containing protein [Eisenibacter elegans]